MLANLARATKARSTAPLGFCTLCKHKRDRILFSKSRRVGQDIRNPHMKDMALPPTFDAQSLPVQPTYGKIIWKGFSESLIAKESSDSNLPIETCFHEV